MDVDVDLYKEDFIEIMFGKEVLDLYLKTKRK